MSNVPAHRPRTFHEALQFHWLMHELIEMEGEYVRSTGQFDRTFYPFYQADIEAGRLTREQAKELIKFFWYKWYARTKGRANGKNFCFGGQHRDGSEITNDLTYLALEAYEELATPDPKLSVRFGPATPDDALSPRGRPDPQGPELVCAAERSRSPSRRWSSGDARSRTPAPTCRSAATSRPSRARKPAAR